MTNEISIPLCALCKRLILEPGFKCEAYPQGVPDLTMSGKINHVLPYDGDNGLMFVPMYDDIDVDEIIRIEKERGPRTRTRRRTLSRSRRDARRIYYIADI